MEGDSVYWIFFFRFKALYLEIILIMILDRIEIIEEDFDNKFRIVRLEPDILLDSTGEVELDADRYFNGDKYQFNKGQRQFTIFTQSPIAAIEIYLELVKIGYKYIKLSDLNLNKKDVSYSINDLVKLEKGGYSIFSIINLISSEVYINIRKTDIKNFILDLKVILKKLNIKLLEIGYNNRFDIFKNKIKLE